jgi:hypothetical protein
VQESHELWRAIEGWRGVETPEAWDAVVVFDILVWPTSMLGNGPPVMA